MVYSVELGGTVYEYDDDELTCYQGLAIEAHIGGTLADFAAGLAQRHPGCLQALAWLVFDGGDLSVPIGTPGDPEVARLAAELAGVS